MEGGCLGYPGASTVASQPLDRIPLPWLANPAAQLWASIQRTHQHWMNQWKERKRKDGGGGTWTIIARNPFKSPAPKNQLLEETPNTLRLRKPAARAAQRHNCYLEHKCKHAEMKLEWAMRACTWTCDCWPRKTPTKHVAINFLKIISFN